MAVPDSLAAWRDFVNRRNVEPEHLTMEQLSALSPAEKEDYDQQRFAWLGADVVLETPDTEVLTHQTRVLMARNSANSATARRGLAISGSAGRGKSTAALLIGRRHERMMRTKLNRYDDGFAPVVYTVVPPGTTPKMMMLAFTNFLGLLVPNKSTAQDLTEQTVGVMRSLSVSLVLVDEVHNLKTNHQAGSEAASALKVFSETLDATFIYAGIDLLQADLFAGHIGRQLKGRMAVHQMRKYEFGTKAQREKWTELVLGVEALLPLGRHAAGTLETEATYLYDRTGGSIGSLRALLNDAAIAAIISGDELVNRKLLDITSTDFAADEAAARTVAEDRAAPMPLKMAE
ncbi:ATP-binding protein [Mycolicibacterium bacteremicum]|uniref:Transposase n=1 Tax=Mycolicibacterium bacteremicum TaxID=564198 RepID=A0A1W9Z4Y5_MYCBA|nr:ATP-binding protein [Mycolicibacterium bacteremicum]MCV7433729.1 ATP-binding protein [Mycolicibacterium bacteremicum]ORA07232.1 transposase [Mycolicibacterium bacteremicum]